MMRHADDVHFGQYARLDQARLNSRLDIAGQQVSLLPRRHEQNTGCVVTFERMPDRRMQIVESNAVPEPAILCLAA